MADSPPNQAPAVASISAMSEADRNKVEQTRERIRASANWLHDNFYGEFQEAFRSYEVKTEKITYPKDHPRAGDEDLTRTNMAMPEMFVGIRKKAVRKSMRPPNINVHSAEPQVAEFLSHMATVQWDRAGEQKWQRKHVLQGDLFGISIKLHYYDSVSQQRTLRYSTDKILKDLYVKIDELRSGDSSRQTNTDCLVSRPRLVRGHLYAVVGAFSSRSLLFNRCLRKPKREICRTRTPLVRYGVNQASEGNEEGDSMKGMLMSGGHLPRTGDFNWPHSSIRETIFSIWQGSGSYSQQSGQDKS